ncbi:MAG: imidazole glycerol phosphate synthase subunit HisH, partial [Lachnospiraceae bacterium]|nr:imidazole glycerol phosphate synthase subunit HisH [Lachnospiraceae bacterium]
MVAIIDYDAGNIKSVEKAMLALGESVRITREPEEILSADHVILPGVGAFGDAMNKIHQYYLADVIRKVVDRGTPFLGICLGLQLLFESSEESEGIDGLGILRGKIVRLPEEQGLKIPHIGWNSLKYPNKGRLFEGISEEAYVYFVHSYYLQAEREQIVTATTEYAAHIHAS